MDYDTKKMILAGFALVGAAIVALAGAKGWGWFIIFVAVLLVVSLA